jgi:hypothetical protein
MPDPRDDFETVERDLRRLRVQDPAPGLRARVLEAVRSASVAGNGRRARAPYRRSWAVEGLLTAAVLLVIWLTAAVDAHRYSAPGASVPRAREAADDCLALGRQPGDWECRRLVAAGRTVVPGVWLAYRTDWQTELGELQ